MSRKEEIKNKKLNSMQSNKIIEHIKKQSVDLDEIQQHIYDMLTINMLTNTETSALLWSVMNRVLRQPHNLTRLEALGIKEEHLNGVDNVLSIQGIWTKEYGKTLDAAGKPKK